MKLRKHFVRLLFAVGIACTLPAVGAAGTRSIVASRDNTLIESATGSLSNGEGDIFVGRTGQGAGVSIRRGLVYFDIADALPSGVTITSVSLQMRDIMGNNGDRAANLHRVLQNWGEGTSFQSGGMGAAAEENDATWLYTFYNKANPTLSPKWTNAGGDFDPAISGSTTIFGNTMGLQSDVVWASSAGMIADVQSWLDTPGTNYGWLIQGVESIGQTAKRLRGHTNNGVDTTTPPVLIVGYIPEPGSFVLLLAAAGCAVFMRPARNAYYA